jgi:hypothetical protein
MDSMSVIGDHAKVG